MISRRLVSRHVQLQLPIFVAVSEIFRLHKRSVIYNPHNRPFAHTN